MTTYDTNERSESGGQREGAKRLTYDVSLWVREPGNNHRDEDNWFRAQRVVEADSVREAIDLATDTVVVEGMDVKVGGAIVSVKGEVG